jgi:ATP-dependent helicase/nuclease subunit B
MPRATRKVSEKEPDLFASTGGSVTRRFLGWDASLVHSVTAHLAAGWDGIGALDLSEWLIVVPTRNASRRLREALAIHAATKNAAVLPPLTVTPDFLTSPERVADMQAAGRVETLLLWAAEMLRMNLEDHRQLFPVDPVERNFTWALKTANDLLQVRETLNENGLSLGDAARMLENSEMEPERWRDLAKLERECLRATEANGFIDWQVARRRAAGTGTLPDSVKRIVIAGVLDPSVLAIQALERHSRRIPVEVLIFAPHVTHSGFFDLWGRPVADAWLTQPIHIPTPENTIHQGSSPAEQAAAAMEILATYPNPGAVAAIGVADAEVSAPLEKTLAEHDIGAYDPAGKRMGTHGVFHLLRLLSQLSASRSFGTAAELMRCPDVVETVRRKAEEQTGTRPSLPQLLKDLDDLAVKALPDTLDDAIELAPRVSEESPIIVGLTWMDAVLKSLAGANFGTALTDFLADVFAARRFRSDRPQDAVFSAIADQDRTVLDALEGPATVSFRVRCRLEVDSNFCSRVLEEQVFYPERAERDIDLQGWLELLWEDAPHLIVTGMNDGKVPESIMAHQFLPDSARRALGLRNNDTRFARDACLMTIIIEHRQRIRRAGGLHLWSRGSRSRTSATIPSSLSMSRCGSAGAHASFFQETKTAQ